MSILATGSKSSNRMTGGSRDIIPKGMRMGQMQQFTPEQMDLFKQLFGHVGQGSFLSQLAGGDEGAFEQMEAPAHRMFNEQMGQLGSRWSQLEPGAMSAQRGSGFNLAGTQAASDFSQDLASQRMGLQRQALMDLMNISNTLLGQKPSEKFLVNKQKRPSFWESLLGGALPAGGALAGGFMGGGFPGALKGGRVGAAAGRGFFGYG